jgi:hypothetical protein
MEMNSLILLPTMLFLDVLADFLYRNDYLVSDELATFALSLNFNQIDGFNNLSRRISLLLELLLEMGCTRLLSSIR